MTEPATLLANQIFAFDHRLPLGLFDESEALVAVILRFEEASLETELLVPGNESFKGEVHEAFSLPDVLDVGVGYLRGRNEGSLHAGEIAGDGLSLPLELSLRIHIYLRLGDV